MQKKKKNRVLSELIYILSYLVAMFKCVPGSSCLCVISLQLSARVKKIWKPQLFKRELYSEILNQKFNITVTARTLDLIDVAYGFDFYILKVTG